VTSGAEGTFELGTDGPRSVLVGVDDSTTSLRAAAYAGGLARRQGATLTIVYVGPLVTVSGSMPGAGDVIAAEREIFDETAADLRQRAEDAARERGLEIKFIAVQGDPFSEIKRIADETRADAVIVGASEKTGHRLIGSIAVRLVRAGRWPVTVVP
jgi:nucleotide-binding universal stress UspA family protein